MMQKQTYVTVLRLLLLLVAMVWGIGQAGAQSKAPTQRHTAGQTTITDAAGRVHVRSVRPTYAQRRAAAKARVKAMREAAAKKKLSEVKK
jgi:hypothetical protein